jgi:hypothetical protein
MLATPQWWGHRARGRFPINWEISPSLYRFAPVIMKYFYDRVSGNDFFVSSSSGQGSIFPNRHPDLTAFLSALEPLLIDADLQIVSAYEPDGLDLRALAPYANLSSVEGVMFKSYLGNYHLSQGVQFINAIPIKGFDYSLWFGDETGESLAEKINGRPRNPANDSNSYSLVAVHPWTPNVMDEMDEAVTRFDPTVKVVSCREMFYHLRTRFNRFAAGTSQCQNLPPSIQADTGTNPFARSNNDRSCAILIDSCPR